MPPKKKARLIEPMLLLRTDELPADGSRWAYQLKVDGYRAIAFTTNTKLHLRSRNDNHFSLRYPTVLKGLAKLPNETIVDGEIVAFDETGRPSFNALQNAASSKTRSCITSSICSCWPAATSERKPWTTRRELPEERVLPKLSEPVRYLTDLDANLPDLIASVRAQCLDGLVANDTEFARTYRVRVDMHLNASRRPLPASIQA
jgi:ATP-dependent DNA ligase